MKQRLHVSLLCCAALAVLAFSMLHCSPPEGTPTVVVYPSARQVFVGSVDPVRLTIEATDQTGKPLAEGAQIKLTATAGSFSKTGNSQTKSVTIAGSAGTTGVEWFPGNKIGESRIVAESEFAKSIAVTILIIEKPKVQPEPRPEPVADKGTDAGGGGNESGNPPDFKQPDLGGGQTSLTMTFAAAAKALRADGEDNTLITIATKSKLDEKTAPKAKFSTTLGTFLDANTKRPLAVKAGVVEVAYAKSAYRVILKAGVTAGTAKIAVNVSSKDYVGEVKGQVDIKALGFINLIEAKPSLIGTQGSGNEVSTVTFQVLDTDKKPLPKGTKVFFSISSPIGGASITTSEGLTDDKGNVSTQIKSGRRPTSVTVTARVVFPAPTDRCSKATCREDQDCGPCGLRCHRGKCMKVLEATSPSIAIVGGQPSYKGMTFNCSLYKIGALYGSIGSNVRANINTNCRIVLADRFSNKVGFPTQVLFMVEAGTIDATARTAAWKGGGGATQDVGTATVSMRTQNPLPQDVPPMSVPNKRNCKDKACTQAPVGGYPFPYDCTSSINPKTEPNIFVEPWYVDQDRRTRNPRDGLVTVVAYTNGEEEFTDKNDNGRYDPGEPFVDLGEPFLDTNDDNVWQPNEQFVDIPCTQDQVDKKQNGCTKVGVGNGRRDGPNGVWDANTLIWKRTWVLWTSGTISSTFSPIRTATDLRGGCKKYQMWSGLSPLTPFATKAGTFVTYKSILHDRNLNPLTNTSTVTYEAKESELIKNPPSNKAHPQGGFGFRILSFRQPQSFGAAIKAFDAIVPGSFFGVKSISHELILGDKDSATKNIPPKADQLKMDVKAQSQAGGNGYTQIILGTAE